jgi:hypothetical protein
MSMIEVDNVVIEEKDNTSQYLANVKGAFGEALIKELFIQNDFIVWDYGVEHLVPSFSPRIKSSDFEAMNCYNSKVIRSLPDMLVGKNRCAEYIEVKYSSQEWAKVKRPTKDYTFHNAFWIYVKPDGIFIEQAKNLMNKEVPRNMKVYNPLNLTDTSILDCEKAAMENFIH